MTFVNCVMMTSSVRATMEESSRKMERFVKVGEVMQSEVIASDDIPAQTFLLSEAENHELVEIFEEKNDSILLAAVALVALVTIVVGIVLKQRSKSKNVLRIDVTCF